MAFVDWDTVKFVNSGPPAFIGGDEGTQQINASLGSPLTLNGADCRRYAQSNTNGVHNTTLTYNLEEIAHPDFFQYPDTAAISVRAWIRSATNNNEKCAVGIHVKGGLGGSSSSNNYHSGLCMGMGGRTGGNANSDNGFLGFAVNGTNGGTLGSPLYTDLVNIGVSTWVQVRIDVIPTKNGPTVDRDTVRAYYNSGTEATPVWTLLQEVVVGPGGRFVPYGTASCRVGFWITMRENFNNLRNQWIDGFDARRVNV